MTRLTTILFLLCAGCAIAATDLALTVTPALLGDPQLKATAGVLRYRTTPTLVVTASGYDIDDAHAYRLTVKQAGSPSTGTALLLVTTWTLSEASDTATATPSTNVATIGTALGNSDWILVDCEFRDDTTGIVLGRGQLKLWNSTSRDDDLAAATSDSHAYTDAQVTALVAARIASPTGSVQGDVLYHNGTAWARLAAGTSGLFLKTLGAGANPAWAAPAIAWGGLTGTLANQTDLQSALDAKSATSHNHSGTYQPADSDLTTFAGITPSANTQSYLAAADYAAMRTLLSLVPGTHVQAYDSDLATWATVTPSANGQSLVSAADYSAMRTLLSLVPGTNVQAYDSDLATWATVTPSANGQSLVAAADYSAMRTALGLGALATLSSVGAATITDGSVGADELASTAVTPASYTYASVTVDADGRITAAANGATPAPMAAIRHVFWPAGAAIPRTTNGAAAGTVETTTADVMYDTYDFDSATSEGVAWVGYLEHWGASTIKFRPVWTAASGTGTVIWSCAGRAYADGDALDQAAGTPQTSTDTYNETAGDVHIGPASAAITIAGTPANGQPVIIQITRDISDTLNADGRLIGIWLEYTEASTAEAAW